MSDIAFKIPPEWEKAIDHAAKVLAERIDKEILCCYLDDEEEKDRILNGRHSEDQRDS